MRAYAPGSVTGLYAPPPPDEPEAASRGASVAIEDGVVVDVTPADESVVTVDGTQTQFEPIERVLDDLEVTAAVTVEPSVPLGHGFGASGAATLATTLAANSRFDLEIDRDELVAAAHRAELAAGTGQGDVFVQARGGLLWSDEGSIRRRTPGGPIEWSSAGPMSTAAFLGDDAFLARARRAGRTHLAALGDAPTLRTFVDRSREYLEATDLATPFATREIDRVDAAGGTASMALFGETVFAVDVEGVLSNRTEVATHGARVLDR